MDINAAVGGKTGLSNAKLEAALGTGDRAVLDDREALVLDYVDGVSTTPVEVPDELFERLRAAFDERSIVELTAVVAHENMNSKFNRSLRVEANGFCTLPLPHEPPRARDA